MAQGPFSDIRILDLSRVLAGPWATQILADLGADVIKIEKPNGGDDTRSWGPPYLRTADGLETSAYFLAANRGKRSLSVDIATPEGQEIIRALVRKSDVLVENFKVGGLEKYGLDYASLCKINPRLVYCSITGFGQDGPYANRAGYDFIIQGMGGLMSITGATDADGGAPTKVGVAIVDIVTGLYASNAITAALRHRDMTGEGQHIDIALLDSAVAMLANQALSHLVSENDSKRLGNAHPSIVPYESFPTADRDIAVAVGNNGQFQRLCTVLDVQHFAQDDRFATNADRVQHRDVLIPLLVERFRTRSSGHWVEALNAVEVPAGAINNLSQVFADPQVRHRKLRIDLQHEKLGTLPGVANPMRFSRTPVIYDKAPPLAGEDNESILQQLYEDMPSFTPATRRAP